MRSDHEDFVITPIIIVSPYALVSMVDPTPGFGDVERLCATELHFLVL